MEYKEEIDAITLLGALLLVGSQGACEIGLISQGTTDLLKSPIAVVLLP